MPIKTFDIPVKAVTPIWTGDAERKTSYLKSSSIIGGLRFWAEAIARSFGHRVCDITNKNNRDVFEPDPKKRKKEICRVCETFGCTGKGKCFSLTLVEDEMEDVSIGMITFSHRCHPDGKGGQHTPEWPLKEHGKKGNFTIKLRPMRPPGINENLALALILMLKWGTFGSRDQYGYGIIKADLTDESTKELLKLASNSINNENTKPEGGITFQDFFFFRGTVKGKITRELPFDIRYLVREHLRTHPASSDALRHYFCGSIEHPEKGATKYNLGLDDSDIVGWGYYPVDHISYSTNRDTCLDILKEEIDRKCSSLKWVEYDSDRDTEGKISDWPNFVRKLLEGEL